LANLTPLIDQKQIAAKIELIAREIDREYQGKDLLILTVLKGSICLVADLIRAIRIPCGIEVVQCQSYGKRGTKRGPLTILGLDRIDFLNRDVLVVDDIFDSGQTLSSLVETLKKKKPRSLRSLVLLKKNTERSVTYSPDYALFEVDDLFVVGFGLDYQEHYRNLPGIFILEQP
jgi:hypoxanthine phosphoribosyltransferase